MKTSLLILAMAAAVPAHAQKTYTLDECRQQALLNNVKVRNAVNSIEAAKEDKRQAFTKYFPTVSATGSAYTANKGLIELDMGQLGSMSMLKDGVTGGVTLTQPVFAGGQIVNANKLADVGVKVSGLQREKEANDVRLTVEKYYWQVVCLKEKLQTVNTVETLLQRIGHDVETAVKAGVRNRNDLLQVQLRQNDTHSTKLDLENNLSVCRMLLAQYIGADSEEVDAVSPMPADSLTTFPEDLYSDPASALPLTPEYRLLESNVDASKLQKKLAVGRNLPTVGVGAGYMYDNLMDKSHTFGLAFVSVSVPLSGWWGGSHDIKKHKIQLANAENSLTDNADLLQIRMRKAWNDLRNAWEQTQIARQSIEQSTENLRLNENYYKAGTSGMSDLLDAQTLFQQSHDKYVDAYAQYQQKRTEYLIATGR